MAKKPILERKRFCITIDTKLIKWLDEQIEKKKYFNRSHAIEAILQKNIAKSTDKKENHK